MVMPTSFSGTMLSTHATSLPSQDLRFGKINLASPWAVPSKGIEPSFLATTRARASTAVRRLIPWCPLLHAPGRFFGDEAPHEPVLRTAFFEQPDTFGHVLAPNDVLSEIYSFA